MNVTTFLYFYHRSTLFYASSTFLTFAFTRLLVTDGAFFSRNLLYEQLLQQSKITLRKRCLWSQLLVKQLTKY